MAITTDNRPFPLHQFNQLLDFELKGIPPPEAPEEPRFFGYKGRIYDVKDFFIPYDGLWNRAWFEPCRVVVQRVEGETYVLVGEF